VKGAGDRINPTVKEIKPSGIRKFFDIAAEIPDAISLGVGEPDFVTPWNVRNAAVRSIQKGYTSYTSNRGLKQLRAEISEYLASRFDLHYCADTVPGIMLAGGAAVPVPTYAEDGFVLTAANLEKAITEKTKVLILPYPNNPTGAVMDKSALDEITAVIKKYDLSVISDEIYAELTYGGKHISVCAADGMKERCVFISGFSKAFAMTGWRLGYVAAPKEISAAMLKIHQYTIMCAPTFAQYAALYALKEGKTEDYADVSYMRGQYDMRRKYLVSRFNSMGLDCFTPRGAFYAFPCVKKTGLDGDAFAERLLKQKHVAVVPGSAFGESGRDFVRCSYACSLHTLSDACARIEEFVGGLLRG